MKKEEVTMSWFNKKREDKKEAYDVASRPSQTEQGLKDGENGVEVIIREFSRTAFNRSRDYAVPLDLTIFSANFDDIIDDLINSCNLDKYNDNFADSTIEANEELAIKEIERQHIKNLETLRMLNTQTWPAELVEYKNALDIVKQKMVACDNDLRKLRSIINKGTVFEEIDKEEIDGGENEK